jgi:hypothetical protein
VNDPMILSRLPRVPDALERALLSEEERTAAHGGRVDAFDWLRAAGRLLRSPAVAVAIRRQLKLACRSAAFSDALLADARARIDVELDVLGCAAEDWKVVKPAPGHAWAMLAARDDLESVAAALGVALRNAPADDAPSLERLDALERFLVDRLRVTDEAFERVEDAVLTALRDAPNDPLRARIAAMGDDPTAGFWFALAGSLAPSSDVLTGLEEAPGDESGPDEPRHRSLIFGRDPRYDLRAGTAAGQQDVLVAFREADREPVATFADGRITLRVRRPWDPSEWATTITGLAIESDPPSLLVDAFAEAAGRRVDSREVAQGARWISFGDLPGAERWTLSLTTSEAQVFHVELRLAPDRAG